MWLDVKFRDDSSTRVKTYLMKKTLNALEQDFSHIPDPF